MAYDIIIKNGLVIDGTGEAAKEADIGIKDNEIAAVGSLGDTKAETVIDAKGKYVTPGFIDITNHSDTHLTLFTYPHLESLVMQGITTIVGGNCGASLAPLGRPEAINAIKKWADPAKLNLNWATVEEYLETVNTIKPGVNFGTFIGFGTLQRGVIGDEIRRLELEEREKVKLMLKEGIEQGAFGISLGLSYGHERAARTEEIIDICRVLSETGGIVKIHLRSEGGGLLASINEAVRIGRETKVPVQISHLKAIGKQAWGNIAKALQLIEYAFESGVNITFDVSPYATTGSALYLLIPPWARQGGFTELFRRIDNPREKALLVKDLKSFTLHYDKILITSAAVKTIVGQTIAQIAETAQLPPEETLIEIVRANEGRVSIIGRTVSVKNVDTQIQNKHSFIASDAAGYAQEEYRSGDLVHPRSFGAFPRFWHRFVEHMKSVSPEEAVVKMASGPAQKLGIAKRGILKKGNFADILVFDPKLLKDKARYRNPFRYAAGLEWSIINGEVAVEQGKYMGVRVGKALRRA